MADNKNFKKTIGDISLLYELSLSIGQSLDLRSNCVGFLKALMARKNLSFASVWIKDKYLPEVESERGASLVYAHPGSRIRETHLPLGHPLFRSLRNKKFVSRSSADAGYKKVVTEKGIRKGTFALFSLDDIGVVKLFSSTRKERFEKKELSQLSRVISKFAISLEGCLAYQKARREILDRRQTEEALKRSEERFKQIAENAQECIWEVDAGGLYTYVSPMVKKILGYTPEEIIGKKHFYDIFHSEDRVRLKKAAFEVFSQKQTFREFLNRNAHKNGRTVWLSTSGVPLLDEKGDLIGYRGADTDITLRKEREEKLRKERDFNKSLLQASPTFFVAINAEGRTLMMNEMMLTTLGYAKEEVVGINYLETFVPERDRERIAVVFKKMVKLHKPSMDQNSVLTRDGCERLVEWHNMPMFKENGEFDFFFGVGIDITERSRMEEELLKASKLESLGIMAGGIAHDFNNILTGILGNISLARMEMEPEEKAVDRMRDAEKAAMRAKNLTQQLLTFSRGGIPIKITASVQDFLKEVVDFALSGSNVTYKLAMRDKIWPVAADIGQISQVMDNLIINAAQAMPEGGTITISVENVTVGDRAHIPLKKGKYVKLSVSDHGIGIKEEHLAKVFDPFFTTKQKGSGLGLTSAYSIVKNHDGFITVDSELHQGTTFSIYLPASSGRVIKKEKGGKRDHIPRTGRILIIDDEEVVRDVAGRYVKHIGFQSDLADGGKRGIALYETALKKGCPYDAVLLDLTMPGGMGGKEVAKKIRALDRGTKIIASSGYSTDPIMSNFRKFGFNGALAKPYQISELSEVLERVINSR